MKQDAGDTIAAIATPLGVGGMGVIRISGQKAKELLSLLFVSSNGASVESHKMLHGWLVNPETNVRLDEIMACYMRGPKSFTGEDVVELYCHGSMAILQEALGLSLLAGARLAERGEYAKRAFLNGRIDLSQAEAVLDLVLAQTARGAGYALRQLEGRLSSVVGEVRERLVRSLAEFEAWIDFPEDLPEPNYNRVRRELEARRKEIDRLLAAGVSSRLYRDGVATAIIGKPNVGKSSLLNALLGEERAIVTEFPGTTRDSIEERVNVRGLPFRVIDTAGIRHPKDSVERFGVVRTEKELEAADFVVVVLDGSRRLDKLDFMVLEKAAGKLGTVVLNKSDKGLRVDMPGLRRRAKGARICRTSALYGRGIEAVLRAMFNGVNGSLRVSGRDSIAINSRHRECLMRASAGLARAGVSCRKKLPVDFVAIDVKDAVIALGEVSGEQVSEEVINSIFEQFCIGK